MAVKKGTLSIDSENIFPIIKKCRLDGNRVVSCNMKNPVVKNLQRDFFLK